MGSNGCSGCRCTAPGQEINFWELNLGGGGKLYVHRLGQECIPKRATTDIFLSDKGGCGV